MKHKNKLLAALCLVPLLTSCSPSEPAIFQPDFASRGSYVSASEFNYQMQIASVEALSKFAYSSSYNTNVNSYELYAVEAQKRIESSSSSTTKTYSQQEGVVLVNTRTQRFDIESFSKEQVIYSGSSKSTSNPNSKSSSFTKMHGEVIDENLYTIDLVSQTYTRNVNGQMNFNTLCYTYLGMIASGLSTKSWVNDSYTCYINGRVFTTEFTYSDGSYITNYLYQFDLKDGINIKGRTYSSSYTNGVSIEQTYEYTVLAETPNISHIDYKDFSLVV